MLENKVKDLFKKVLDIDPSEIKDDQTLEQSLGIDSTELVEISVAIKKELGIPLADGELKKSQTFGDMVALLKTKPSAGSGSCGCGCAH